MLHSFLLLLWDQWMMAPVFLLDKVDSRLAARHQSPHGPGNTTRPCCTCPNSPGLLTLPMAQDPSQPLTQRCCSRARSSSPQLCPCPGMVSACPCLQGGVQPFCGSFWPWFIHHKWMVYPIHISSIILCLSVSGLHPVFLLLRLLLFSCTRVIYCNRVINMS